MELQNNYLLIAAALLSVLVLAVVLVLYIRHRRHALNAVIRRHAWGQARDVVIPDGMDGHVHIDRVLLTSRGLIALDIRALRGAIFGADKMEEWVMLDNGRRHGFRNPLVGLDERATALRQFVTDVEVDAFVMITGPVEFPKGRPERTLQPEDLAERLEPVSGPMPDNWRAVWDKVAEHAKKA